MVAQITVCICVFTLLKFLVKTDICIEGGDYQGLSQVIEFTGESTMTLSVVLVDDSVVEGSEWFTAHLRGTTNNGVILTNDSLNITLLDDDSELCNNVCP